MALRSQLFQGDPALEAAAVSDPAHIMPGARGEHVRKIQLALTLLDGTAIVPDGVYGHATAEAVLAYKQKRQIVNRAFQTKADNIVGRMTLACLDAELDRLENPRPIKLRVLSPVPDRLNHRPQVHAIRSGGPMLALSLTPAVHGAPSFSPGPVITIAKGQTAVVEVRDGQGAQIIEGDPKIATVHDPRAHGPLNRITADPQTIEIVGHHRGGAVIVLVYGARGGLLGLPYSESVSLTVSVREPRTTPYVPTMTPHNHQPTRRWSQLVKAIEQPSDTVDGKALWVLCAAGADPQKFVDASIVGEFRDKPTALKHLNWYLRDGRGQEYNEDDNIEQWVKSDAAIRSKILTYIVQNVTRGVRYSFSFAFGSSEFANQDFRYAFGTIDRLDVEVDWVAKTVKVFFMDIYEWHPVCPGFYTTHADDVVRFTNSLHAALVELKLRGAADFWMVGEATLPMSAFGFPP